MSSAAIDKLRARVQAAAEVAYTTWRDADIEELEAAAARHKAGENINGWKNPYPGDDPRSLLLEYQFAYWHDKSRFKAGLWSRQSGKDFTTEGEAVEDCLVNHGTEWMVAAPSERQALDSLDKAKDWAEAFDLQIADYQERREGSSSETLLKSAEITWHDGSRMRAVPGKPDTVRGRSANVLLTEFDFFEDPAATWRAILPSITNPLRGGQKKLRLVTTPNGTGGAMHKIWTKGDGRKMKWSRHLVTIYHAVLMGLPVDIEEIKEAFDDPEGFAQEFLCQFLDGSAVLLPYDIIALAEDFEASEFWDLESAGTAHPTYLGIDFGRTNDPTVCWTLQQMADTLWTREVLVLRDTPTNVQEQILRDRIATCRRCCMDYTGPGIGLGDYLIAQHGQWKPEAHKFGKVELCTFTTGFKREIFPRLRRRFEAPTKLRIPVSVAIREDLHAMQQVINNGEYNYWSPRAKEGHSDRCTALALANRATEFGTRTAPPMPMPRDSARQRAARTREVTV